MVRPKSLSPTFSESMGNIYFNSGCVSRMVTILYSKWSSFPTTFKISYFNIVCVLIYFNIEYIPKHYWNNDVNETHPQPLLKWLISIVVVVK